MKIVKLARKFNDEESWRIHGVNLSAMRLELKPFKDRRNATIAEAIKVARELGHELSPDWSPLNSNRCRKCGSNVELPNVFAKTDAPDIRGAAVTYKCNVSLANCGPDIIYWRDFEINVGSDVALV